MDSKVIKLHLCFLERSYAVLNELNTYVQPRPSHIYTNTDSYVYSTKELTQTKQWRFFIQLRNPCQHFISNHASSTPTHVKEIFEQPIVLNLYTKLYFSSNNPYIYSILPKNITDKFTIIRNICRFFQPGLIF